jgi:serine protein kinase
MENQSMLTKLKKITSQYSKEKFQTLHSEMSLAEYLELLYESPKLARSAYQIMFDMIMEKGCFEYEVYRKKITHYNFFDDPENPIIGLPYTKDELVKFIKGAAGGFGTERRVLLLHGPVGSSKSTLCRLLKRSLEKYSLTDAGAWYSFKWVNLPTGADGIYTHETNECPMHEDPLKLFPPEMRSGIIDELNAILYEKTPEKDRLNLYRLGSESEMCPRCGLFMDELLKKYNGDIDSVLEKHIVVVRKVFSEFSRCGIATFQPKDEKNQDSTELTGDIDFSKIAKFGSDSDARCFAFNGEFCVGNRGMVEFIEMLKLEVAFLYDLLGATQERQIKPKKFAQVSVDEVIIGHSNQSDYEKLKSNPYMEALRDRTVKIDVPYTLKWADEIKILEKDYGPEKVKQGKIRQHIAPHTLEIAALWAILTRLQDDKDSKVTLVDKVELYNGKLMPGWTEDSVKEMIDRYSEEGMQGVSPRYVQDKISNCLSNNHEYINPFMVLNELKEGLQHSSLIVNKEQIGKYVACVDLAIKKLTEILKTEVQKALVGDEDAIIRICTNYIDNIMAYISKAKIRNKITQMDQAPDERLMRSIEEKIEIPEQGADDFRRVVAAFIGDFSHKGKKFAWDSNPQLKKALEAKLFEETKHHIKLSALNMSGSAVVDPDIQQKIDAIKTRLINQYGYNDKSATDVLDFVGSIFTQESMGEE